ncbi:MAG: YeeE/YedE family protein [Methylococcales bacterium]|nr:YeeE/YedE family protein [Methylococcales bacterium]
MSKNIYAFIFGLLFGLGLIVSQMSNPNKVLAFLDVAGNWDPSLVLVMVSALLVLGVSLRRMRSAAGVPLLQDREAEQQSCEIPKCGVDCQLVIGAIIFGAGWGLSGICPGPAIVGLATGIPGFYLFAASMFGGFFLFNRLHRK